MPAGERTPFLAEPGKQAYGFLDRSRSVICKSGWYHMHFPSDRPAGPPYISTFPAGSEPLWRILRRFAQDLFHVRAASMTIATPTTSAAGPAGS
jgi:hypothetical protein